MVAYDILSLLSSVIKENGELKINYLLNENGYIARTFLQNQMG